MIASSATASPDLPFFPFRRRCTLRPHTAAVNCLTFSRGGDFILAASSDKTVSLSNPFTGRCLAFYGGDVYQSVVTCVSGGFGNATFLSTAADGRAFLWDVATQQVIRTFSRHKGQLKTCLLLDTVFCPSNNSSNYRNQQRGSLGLNFSQLALLAGEERVVRIFDVRQKSRQIVQELYDAKDAITDLAFTGDSLLASSADGCVYEYDIRKGCLHIDEIAQPISSMCLSRDRQSLLLACTDGTIRFQERLSGEVLLALTGHHQAAQSQQQQYRIDTQFALIDRRQKKRKNNKKKRFVYSELPLRGLLNSKKTLLANDDEALPTTTMQERAVSSAGPPATTAPTTPNPTPTTTAHLIFDNFSTAPPVVVARPPFTAVSARLPAAGTVAAAAAPEKTAETALEFASERVRSTAKNSTTERDDCSRASLDCSFLTGRDALSFYRHKSPDRGTSPGAVGAKDACSFSTTTTTTSNSSGSGGGCSSFDNNNNSGHHVSHSSCSGTLVPASPSTQADVVVADNDEQRGCNNAVESEEEGEELVDDDYFAEESDSENNDMPDYRLCVLSGSEEGALFAWDLQTAAAADRCCCEDEKDVVVACRSSEAATNCFAPHAPTPAAQHLFDATGRRRRVPPRGSQGGADAGCLIIRKRLFERCSWTSAAPAAAAVSRDPQKLIRQTKQKPVALLSLKVEELKNVVVTGASNGVIKVWDKR